MKMNKRTEGAFTLIELLIVITIIGILASTAMPAYNGIQERGKRMKAVSNVKNILIACRGFAADWDGLYPSFDPEDDNADANTGFGTSTEAFNVLIPDYIDSETLFWVQTKDQSKIRPPQENGELTAEENVYAYVQGQTDTSFSRSPLVADGLMDAVGTYGEFHPWLNSKKAIVGYCGGHVVEERLTDNQAGATIKSKDGLTDDIFQERGDGGDGAGYLDVSQDNVLLPD